MAGQAAHFLPHSGKTQKEVRMQISDLKGKAALVTGSSTGIGAAVARGFARQGMRVALHCNASRGTAEKLLAELRAEGAEVVLLQADLRCVAGCTELVNQAQAAFGRLDVLVNNAGGVVQRRALGEIDDALYDDIVNLNARSVFACSRAALPFMLAQGGGAIISTTSLAARSGGGSKSTLYAASKAFVSTFTRGLAKEVGRTGIRVNAVAPGVIIKPEKGWTMPDHQVQASVKLTPLRRLGTVEECVGAYLFLASGELSGFITGQVLEVNGGLQMP
jgi:3-oxoacyl-[acyl-carrier protein] reductase